MKKFQGGESRISILVGAAAATSVSSSSYSFFVETLPVLQWIAVLVGMVSGVIAIAVGVKTLRKR